MVGRYGFTQIGVGGVVVNTKGEVLMVQERVSPLAQYQGYAQPHHVKPRVAQPHHVYPWVRTAPLGHHV